MNRPLFYTALLLVLSVVAGENVAAQSQTRITVTADRREIQIGQPIILQFKADIPEEEAIQFFELDSIPHFEFLEKKKVDTTNTNRGTLLTQEVRITSFDSGHWVIPAFVLADSLRTDSIPVDVVYSGFDTRQDYHDIADVEDVKVDQKKDERWWYFVAAGVVLLILVGWFIWRKTRSKPVQAPPPPRDPFREAMQELDVLRPGDDIKLYYSKLTTVFREYLYQKKNIRSLQETTGELVQQMRGLSLPAASFERLTQVLRLADFVKFAKFIPAAEDNAGSMQVIRQAITEIEQLP